jgi:hypothetical protein
VIRFIRSGAGAVLAIALASGPAAAIEPDVLPEVAWWRVHEVASLARDPLSALAAPPGAGIEAEWAPLYRGRDDARYESSRRSLRTTGASGSWRFATELDQRTLALRGGEGIWRLHAERPLEARAAAGIAGSYRRVRLAVSAGGAEGSAPALAGGARVELAPGWDAEARWSLEPDQGLLRARWDDVHVLAPGRWKDRRIALGIGGTLDGLRWSVVQSSLDRGGLAAGGGDRLAPTLAWRSSRVDLSAAALGTRWDARLEHGEGREGFRVYRDAAPYVTVAGPVVNSSATLSARPARSSLAGRLWIGCWRGDANGALALWPFDELALIAGTRRVAESSVRLNHGGVAIDRLPGGTVIDGGLALWRVAPVADYESWQATAMGMGRDDPSSGVTAIRSAWIAGVRLAAGVEWAGVALRLEGVQWVPVRIERAGRATGGGSSSGGDPGSTGASGTPGKEWGGTVIRFVCAASR